MVTFTIVVIFQGHCGNGHYEYPSYNACVRTQCTWKLTTIVNVAFLGLSIVAKFRNSSRCAPGDPLLGIGNADNKSVIKSPGLATDSHLKVVINRLIFCVVQTTNICEI